MGIEGVEVRLYRTDQGLASPQIQFTDENGRYLFTDLPDGTYFVEFILPGGYTFVTPNQGGDDNRDSDANPGTGRTDDITVNGGESNLTIDAGIFLSPPCDLTVEVSEIVCDDNATASTADDLFSFILTVSGKDSGSWTTTINGQNFTGDYNTAVAVGPFFIADGAASFVISDTQDQNCTSILTTVAPTEDCIQNCQLGTNVLNVLCDDNGTPMDPSDDVFTFDVVVSGINTSTGWAANDPAFTIGNYGDTVSFGPYAIADGDIELMIIDLGDGDCNASIEVSAPLTCSNDMPCLLVGIPSNIQCHDNGTPNDPSDDVFTFDLLVNNGQSQGDWVADGMGSVSGSYGELVQVGPLPIEGDQVSFMIRDAADSSCMTQVWVDVPNQCSVSECQITASVISLDVDEQAESFSFTVIVSGFNASIGWIASDAKGTRGLYDQAVVFGPYPIDEGAVEIMFMDLLNNACATSIRVEVPGNDYDCPPDTVGSASDARIIDLFGGSLTTQSDTISDVSSLPWTTDRVMPSGIRYLATNTFEADSSGDYTFLLYVNTMTTDNLGGTQVGLEDGNGALLLGTGERSTWMDSLIAPCDNPLAYEAASFNYDLIIDTLGDQSYVVAMRFNAHLDSGQVYTLVNSTFSIENTGDYYWAVVPEGDTPRADLLGNSQTTGGTLTRDLTVADLEAIFNNPASLDYLGSPSGEEIIDIQFTDQYLAGDECAAADTILRQFTITFADSTIAEDCEQVIILRKLLLVDVSAPICNLYYDCSELIDQVDENGHPHPSITGYPQVVSLFDIYDLDSSLVNLSASYLDTIITDSLCSGSYDIHRTWTLVDECFEGMELTYQQVIHIGDFTGPVVSCPVSNHYCPILEEDIMLFSLDPFGCTADIELPLPEVEDACSDSVIIVTEVYKWVDSIEMLVARYAPGEDRLLEGMMAGDYFVRYMVSDDCGNTTVQDCRFRIADLEAPIVVCTSQLDVSLGTSGAARTYAHHLDNASYDNCGDLSFSVRRILDTITVAGVDSIVYSEWSDYVQYDCSDVGSTVMVELRAEDEAGNVNNCMTSVNVVDKMAPWCGGLYNTTVYCEDLPLDFLPSNVQQLQAVFGMAFAYDNCSALVTELVPVIEKDDLGNCIITRRFTAIDEAGNEALSIFTQDIVIRSSTGECDVCDRENTLAINCAPNNHYCPIIEQDIMLFSTDSTTCTATINVPYPTVENACSDSLTVITEVLRIEYDYVIVKLQQGGYRVDTIELVESLQSIYPGEDRVISGLETGDYFFKYTVVDTCGNRGVQLCRFRVADLVTPVVVSTDELRVAIGGQGFARIYVSSFDRGSYDNCDLDRLEVRRLLWDDTLGTADLLLPYFGPWQSYVDFTCDDIARDVIVELRAMDKAGNANISYTNVFALDLIEPSCGGLADISVLCSTLPTGFDVNDVEQLQAQFGMAKALDNCEAFVEELKPVTTKDDEGNCVIQRSFIAFDGSGNVSQDSFIQRIEIIADTATCEVCNSSLLTSIEGQVRTPALEPIEGVEVVLSGRLSSIQGTEVEGDYVFESILTDNDYSVVAHKDDDHRNGVSTLDMIQIARHIRGDANLTSALQLIAADVNNSKSISIGDLIEMRRLILGNIEAYETNSSWRFVAEDYVFSDQVQPWKEQFAEIHNINDITSVGYQANFIGVKVGDVNHSASANSLAPLKERALDQYMELQLTDQDLKAGQSYEVAIRAKDLAKFMGYQFTLAFDPQQMSIEQVLPGIAQSSNLGVKYLDRGLLTLSWHELDGKAATNEAIIRLQIRATNDARLSDLLQVNSAITTAEAYDYQEQIYQVKLGYDTEATIEKASFELLQNYPNPFREETVIGFTLPEAGEARIILHNASGKVVKIIEGAYSSGYNEVRVSRGDLQAKGLYYYTLQAEDRVATKKMSIME